MSTISQSVIYPQPDQAAFAANRPVVIETAHNGWVRRDMAGLCFRTAREAYAFMASHAPSGRLSDCCQITALLDRWASAQPARDVRRELYGRGGWAATTTLPTFKDAPNSITCAIEAVAIDAPGRTHAHPSWLYDLSDMVLSPVVVQPLGGDRLIHLSGIVSWDPARQVLNPGDIQRQIETILDYADRLLREQGCSLRHVVCVRTFSAAPAAGANLMAALARRVDAAHLVSCHHLTTLDEEDLGGLVSEVQFLAVDARRGRDTEYGVIASIDGLRHFYLTAQQCSFSSDSIDLAREARDAAAAVVRGCKAAGFEPARYVSLFAEACDQDAARALCCALEAASDRTIRCGITASINRRLLERVGRRIVISGVAIGELSH